MFNYTYFMTYSRGFVIIIPDKMTISVVSWHQMDTRLTRFLLDTRLVLETRLLLEVLRYDTFRHVEGRRRRPIKPLLVLLLNGQRFSRYHDARVTALS